MSTFQEIIKKEMQVDPMSTFPERLEAVLDPLLECARYIVEFEEEDFRDAIYYHGDDEIQNHIFTKAFRILYGENALQDKITEVRSDQT